MISIRDLHVGFQRAPLVANLSLTVEAGGILALVGASGSGKTTLLRSIAGLHNPDSGEILVLETHPQKLYGSGRLHYLHQSPALWRHLTVDAHIRLALKLVDEPIRDRRLESLVDQLGFVGSESKFPHELSKGMQARLALARAFASPPEVLLVDEPFANLDQLRRERLNEHLQQLKSDARCTIVMVTHDIVEAIRFSTKILVFPNASADLVEIKMPKGLNISDPNALPAQAREIRDRIVNLIQGPKRGGSL